MPGESHGPQLTVFLDTVGEDEWHSGQGFHVINYCRFTPEPALRGKGRFRRWHASFAFDGGNERCFLSAHKGAGAFHDFQIKGMIGSEDMFSKNTQFVGIVDGLTDPFDCQRIFGAYIDISLISLDSAGGDSHPFYDAVRIALHDTHIHKGARVTLVTVADHIFLCVLLFSGKVPLLSRGKTAAAPAPQA